MLIDVIQKILAALILVVLIFNLTQRPHLKHGEKKRIATLAQAGLLLLLYAAAISIERFTLNSALLLPAILIAIGVGFWQRKHVFPYQFSCKTCEKRLSIGRILYWDNNLCKECSEKENPQLHDKEE